MIGRILLILSLMTGAALAQGEFRIFHAGDRTIEARVLTVNAKQGVVELELRNKQRKKINSSIFSKTDQSYLRDFAKVQEFQTQGFRIEVEKNVVSKRKETQSGVLRSTESICYDIKINNNTGIAIDGVTISYNLFYEQEEVGQGQNDTKRLYVDGELKVEPLPPRKKVSLQTARFEVYDQRLTGGYDGYVGGAPTHQSGKSKGAWLKVHIKTKSGLSATRDVCLPKNTNTLFSWQTSDQGKK